MNTSTFLIQVNRWHSNVDQFNEALQNSKNALFQRAKSKLFIWQSAFYQAWEKGVLKLPDHVSKWPKRYKLELKKFSDNLNVKIPEALVHTIIHFPVLAHGLVSIELTGRYGYLIDFGQFYTHKIIHELKQIGIEPNLTSLKL